MLENGDISLKYLSYYSDNGSIWQRFASFNTAIGAYYYYKTIPGKNYAETFASLMDYFENISLPIKAVQYDRYPQRSLMVC